MAKIRFLGLAFLVMTALLLGCSLGSGGTGSGGGGRSGAASATLVNFGDAAPDRVLALKLTVQDILINQSGGASSTVLNAAGAYSLETTHRAALLQPVNINTDTLTTGTFSGVTIHLATPASVTFVDDLGVVRQDNAAVVNSTTVTVNFASSVTVTDTSTPMVLNLVLSPSSIAINTGTNTATITPTFTATLAPADPAGTQKDTTGMTRMLLGVVTATSGTQVTLSSSQLARNLTFNTNGSTAFTAGSDVSSFAGIVTGNVVQVQSQMQPTGIPLITNLDGENAGAGLTTGGDLQGIVDTATVGGLSPFNVTSFGLRIQDAASTAAPPTIGTEITINDFTTPTVFLVDQQDVDLTNLSFTPTFDQVHIRPPQEVSAIYSNVAATAKPKKLKLRLQTLFGTAGAVTGGAVLNQTIIPFTPPADSMFVLLTGQTTLTVVAQPSSDTTQLVPASGLPMHVRGLLFFDDVSGKYFLIADHFEP